MFRKPEKITLKLLKGLKVRTTKARAKLEGLAFRQPKLEKSVRIRAKVLHAIEEGKISAISPNLLRYFSPKDLQTLRWAVEYRKEELKRRRKSR